MKFCIDDPNTCHVLCLKLYFIPCRSMVVISRFPRGATVLWTQISNSERNKCGSVLWWLIVICDSLFACLLSPLVSVWVHFVLLIIRSLADEIKVLYVMVMLYAGAGNKCTASNGGCSHICVPLRQSATRCLCPSPMVLASDKMTCTGTQSVCSLWNVRH